jgi:hypothetical protein
MELKRVAKAADALVNKLDASPAAGSAVKAQDWAAVIPGTCHSSTITRPTYVAPGFDT